jgi:hypothetical protein
MVEPAIPNPIISRSHNTRKILRVPFYVFHVPDVRPTKGTVREKIRKRRKKNFLTRRRITGPGEEHADPRQEHVLHVVFRHVYLPWNRDIENMEVLLSMTLLGFLALLVFFILHLTYGNIQIFNSLIARGTFKNQYTGSMKQNRRMKETRTNTLVIFVSHCTEKPAVTTIDKPVDKILVKTEGTRSCTDELFVFVRRFRRMAKVSQLDGSIVEITQVTLDHNNTPSSAYFDFRTIPIFRASMDLVIL